MKMRLSIRAGIDGYKVVMKTIKIEGLSRRNQNVNWALSRYNSGSPSIFVFYMMTLIKRLLSYHNGYSNEDM